MFTLIKVIVLGAALFCLGCLWTYEGFVGEGMFAGTREWPGMTGLIWKGPILASLGGLIFGYSVWFTKNRYLKPQPTKQEMEKLLQIALRDLQTGVQPDKVEFDEVSLIFSEDGAPVSSMRWDEVSEIAIRTTDEGPAVDDVFFDFVGGDSNSVISVPQTAEGVEELLTRLQTLPGFNNKAMIDSMSSTDNARFVCWARS